MIPVSDQQRHFCRLTLAAAAGLPIHYSGDRSD
jgi:hypothetical protein